MDSESSSGTGGQEEALSSELSSYGECGLDLGRLKEMVADLVKLG